MGLRLTFPFWLPAIGDQGLGWALFQGLRPLHFQQGQGLGFCHPGASLLGSTMRAYHPGGSRRKLGQKFLVSGPRDRLIESELSGAAGLMGSGLFWDLRENMGPEKVLKRRRWEGSEQLKWRHPFHVKCSPAGEGESGGTGAGNRGLGQLPPTLTTPSTKTPGVTATLLQKQEEEGVSRALPGAPFPPAASLPLHLQSSPSSCGSLLGLSW